jgi:phage antirepressor YoqD-like protein
MSTLEIAELTGKRHDHVMRDARFMLAELHGPDRLPSFGGTVERPNPSGGRPLKSPVLALPKRETLILVSGYSLPLRTRIIDRWQELEARSAFDPAAFFESPAAMRGLLLSYTEKVLALQAENEVLAVKGDALDRIADADGSFCVTDAAKTLQVRPKDLFSFLRSHGWIYERAGTSGYIGYQSKLTSGLLEHKTTTVHRSDGSEKVTTQVRVTAKGLTRLAQEFPPAMSLAA